MHRRNIKVIYIALYLVGYRIKKTKLSLQLFLMANLYCVNGPIDMRVGKDADLRIS